MGRSHSAIVACSRESFAMLQMLSRCMYFILIFRNWFNQSLSGPISDDFGSLKSLQSLNLSNNQLSGSIQGKVGKLTSLRLLSIFRNDLDGPIPDELGNLAQLVVLYV